MSKETQWDKERLLALDLFSEDEVDTIIKNWERKLPTDPEERLNLARKAVSYETVMRGLNYDLSTGRITKEEYEKKELEARYRHFD